MNDSDYEDQLGNALERLLDQGADDLKALASGLNTLRVPGPSGEPWTPVSLEAEFKRLAH